MPRSSRRTVEDTENRVLYIVNRPASPRRPACLSLRAIARELGVSDGRVRTALRSLASEGFVTAEARFADDGGQLANGYRLTRAGRERLRLAIEGGELVMGRRAAARSRDPSPSRREPLLAATKRDQKIDNQR